MGVLGHGERWRKGPFLAGCARGGCGVRSQLLNKRRVIGRAKADIVREYRRAINAIMAAQRINAPNEWDLTARFGAANARRIKIIGLIKPGLR